MMRPRSSRTRLGGKLGFIEDRRAHVQRVEDFLIRPHYVSGFSEIHFASGARQQQIVITVEFPVWFVDRPAMSFGGELIRDVIVPGQYPTCSVVIVGWEKIHEMRVGGGYYTGARLAVVATGRDDERLIVHWQAEGKALRAASEAGS